MEGKELPQELNLLWYYPDIPMLNSPVPLAEVPDLAPVNYLYHHHLEINLLNQTIQFREAAHDYQWHPRISRAHAALNTCLEVAIPWADLQVPPDYPIRLIMILADEGCFHSHLPEDILIPIEVP